MAVSVGDRIPDVEVRVLGDDGAPMPVQTGDILGSGKVVLFAVPGAFTPGCSKVHMPGFVQNEAELAAKGVTKVACISVNDAWVMGAWGEAQGATDIMMLGDGNGEFTAAMGLAWAAAHAVTPQSSKTVSSPASTSKKAAASKSQAVTPLSASCSFGFT